jgi:hypothetical protein
VVLLSFNHETRMSKLKIAIQKAGRLHEDSEAPERLGMM